MVGIKKRRGAVLPPSFGVIFSKPFLFTENWLEKNELISSTKMAFFFHYSKLFGMFVSVTTKCSLWIMRLGRGLCFSIALNPSWRMKFATWVLLCMWSRAPRGLRNLLKIN